MRDVKKLYNQIVISLLLVFVIGGYSILILASFYCYPNAEDLQIASLAKNLGFNEAIKHLLVFTDGRYSANLLYVINPLVYNRFDFYKIMPFIGTLLFVFSISFLLRALYSNLRILNSLLLASSFCFLYFALTASLPHLLFWMSSSFVYLWAWSFYLLWLGLFIYYIKHKQRQSTFFFVIVLIFISAGFNEMQLLLNAITISACILYLVLKKRDYLAALALFFALVISTSFFILMPGVQNRLIDQGVDLAQVSTLNLSERISLNFAHTLAFLTTWPLISTIGIFSFIVYPHISSFLFDKGSRLTPLRSLVIIALLILVFLLVNMAYYLSIQREFGFPNRIFSYSSLIGIMIWLVLFLAVINYFKSHTILYSFILIMFVLWSIPNISKNNFVDIVKDYKSKLLSIHDHHMKERYMILRSTSNSKQGYKRAVVPYSSVYPKSIFNNTEISPNRENSLWNYAYESYFNIDEVSLDIDSVRKYTP